MQAPNFWFVARDYPPVAAHKKDSGHPHLAARNSKSLFAQPEFQRAVVNIP
jgi:hypothetical protein